MGLSETLIFYFLIGITVAVAVFLRNSPDSAARQSFCVTTAALFWPLYIPILLTRPPQDSTTPIKRPEDGHDDMAGMIAQVEAELDAALSSLDGWAEDVLARETERIHELRSAWTTQAARIREIDRLLAQPEFATSNADSKTEADSPIASHYSPDPTDRRRQSEDARRRNIERLRQVRRQAHDDLMGTLAWVRELVSMIHLAKFTGAPASRAEELVAQIAAAVEGVSAVTWQEEVAV
jgi:hypothetical protein